MTVAIMPSFSSRSSTCLSQIPKFRMDPPLATGPPPEVTESRSLTGPPPPSAMHSFVLEFDPEVQQLSAPGIKKFRDLCEAALTAVGLHVTEGGRVWAIYR